MGECRAGRGGKVRNRNEKEEQEAHKEETPRRSACKKRPRWEEKEKGNTNEGRLSNIRREIGEK